MVQLSWPSSPLWLRVIVKVLRDMPRFKFFLSQPAKQSPLDTSMHSLYRYDGSMKSNPFSCLGLELGLTISYQGESRGAVSKCHCRPRIPQVGIWHWDWPTCCSPCAKLMVGALTANVMYPHFVPSAWYRYHLLYMGPGLPTVFGRRIVSEASSLRV
jgi:hypothetical protein